MIWWRRCSTTHGEREGKAAFVGRDAAHHLSGLLCVVSVSVSVCVCVCFFFFFWPASYLSGRKSI
jgi:hypothetical protein